MIHGTCFMQLVFFFQKSQTMHVFVYTFHSQYHFFVNTLRGGGGGDVGIQPLGGGGGELRGYAISLLHDLPFYACTQV